MKKKQENKTPVEKITTKPGAVNKAVAPKVDRPEPFVKKAKIDVIGVDKYQLTLMNINPPKGLNFRETKALSLSEALAAAETFLKGN